jgi:prevent-host-death family protein
VEPASVLTYHVHRRTLMSMSHRASSSKLKAKMGQYMRAVRAGEEVVVTDRGDPVARLVPYLEADAAPVGRLEVAQARDPGAPPFSAVEVRPIRYRGRSTTALLEADRKRR